MAERAEKGRLAIVAMLVAGGIVASCGTSEDRPSDDGTGNPGTPDGGGGGGWGEPDGNGGGNGGGFDPNEDGGGAKPDGGFSACASDTQRGKPIPLTMAMMLDSSGSMWLRTKSGEFKWDAVKKALPSFLNDPRSNGMGIGLQYFPLFRNQAPNRCTESSQCGAAGPCVLKACSDAAGNYCSTDAECPTGATCSVKLGQCHEQGEFKCRNDEDCKTAYGEFGKCDPIVASYCFREEESCVAADYGTPEVPIAPLPGVAAAMITSLNGHFPNGYTPTSAALDGLENMAKAHKAANANDVVVSVLVTDGLPTRCDQNMANITAIAANANEEGIKTYVIGVFAPSEEAQAKANLDLIAKHGGTQTAFIINTSENVTQEFLKALNAIRGSALPCEFTLPIPQNGAPDYAKVNVRYTAGGGAGTLVPYVAKAASCHATTGGWYYDIEPTGTAVPTKVRLCPVTCNAVKADSTGVVDIEQGCKGGVQ